MTTHRLYMAPMKGFTDCVFRHVFAEHFHGFDLAITPFIASKRDCPVRRRHVRDVWPEHNTHLMVVPQILSKVATDFAAMANFLYDMGYDTVNWNLGCPYPMVAKKMRGSGLLPHPDVIDRILERVMSGFRGKLSVKTRIGRHSADEMEKLIPVFNRYPLTRVIVHPRTGAQMYTGNVDLKAFQFCLFHLSHPVVFNGDITNVSNFRKLEGRFQEVSGWMIGRGLITNPFLGEMIQNGTTVVDRSAERFILFHDQLVDGYRQRFSGPGHVLDRMKGFWRYFADGFDDGRRILKRIRKAGSLDRYKREVVIALGNHEGWTG